jgi:hypothetical protein
MGATVEGWNRTTAPRSAVGDVLYVLAVTTFLALMAACVLLWDRAAGAGAPTSPVDVEPAGSRPAGPATTWPA